MTSNFYFPPKRNPADISTAGMVAIKLSESSERSSSVYEIVDGQQRLATFCLLLAQIAVRADELESGARAQGRSQRRTNSRCWAARSAIRS